MKAPKTFEELTGGNKELAKQLSEVYNGDIELVDTLVGSHSEPLIPGFICHAFSAWGSISTQSLSHLFFNNST
jgi:hypothetical protein